MLGSASTTRPLRQKCGTRHQSKAWASCEQYNSQATRLPSAGTRKQETDPLCTPRRCMRSLSSAQRPSSP